ncbi:MAG: toprim domain-containing protein [Thermoguttaceae bacterium]
MTSNIYKHPRISREIWHRVSKRRPCPICGKPDWCLFAGDPTSPNAAICQRVQSPKRCGEAGWLHILRHDGPAWSPRVRRIELSAAHITTPALNLDTLAADCTAAVRSDVLERLAVTLGVSVESLRRLGVGWSAQHRAWTFPMKNVAGNVLGIRLRLSNGKKLSVKGGKEGLFVPEGIDAHSLLLVCEGPTDTAAMLDLGFFAVGRPSCTVGVKLLVELVMKWKPANVIIVADGDLPGRRGAEALASVLCAYARSVRIITPPFSVKDARQWKLNGATPSDVQAAIDAAPIRKLGIVTRKAVAHAR